MLYPIEQTSKLFDNLPPELRAAILSEDTADSIRLVCERNKITEQMSDLAILVGNILLGLLPPSDLPAALTQELKIPAVKAKNISQEINRLIFYPVRDKIAELYKAISPTLGDDIASPSKRRATAAANQPAVVDTDTDQNEIPVSDDTYREIVD
ncbi:hypothetical protein COZ78_02120 [bacterium (Candidatus Gribaldobacteria) CG_4_8_14_3_um_filter_42_11]|uniref:Uncharacterized protein n=1 Tax=bacterium (Candidatus Gribaldobacteria) CG_4_8_14_3_um_filter_42_11 TaxID=2014267 RepID=A0A2M7IYC8_9BACT|nr:MAG: hypothetical protein COZ78_02120 [bacterium (Candidatus Gribaldobacteria) CG_4_8_14_3_um_filter_42_11]